jgi:hypothetical protein
MKIYSHIAAAGGSRSCRCVNLVWRDSSFVGNNFFRSPKSIYSHSGFFVVLPNSRRCSMYDVTRERSVPRRQSFCYSQLQLCILFSILSLSALLCSPLSNAKYASRTAAWLLPMISISSASSDYGVGEMMCLDVKLIAFSRIWRSAKSWSVVDLLDWNPVWQYPTTAFEWRNIRPCNILVKTLYITFNRAKSPVVCTSEVISFLVHWT